MTAAAGKGDLSITLGIEEEFFLVDPDSRDLLADPDPGIFKTCDENRGPHKVVREFLRSQIETNTRVCGSVAEVRTALQETRRIVIEAAERHGAAVMAASTHPFAIWRDQSPTPRDRYTRFAATYQEAVRRAVVGGMHIHAGFGDADTRIRVMTAIRRYLPLLHALSTSSPFNAGHETGFKSYRLTIIGN
ncbi:MAG: glutamate-cysteine ligase family protein, partial [Rhodospirillaceae bacterium]|nr:glutamate-cysteine ligase family protein [Rhodospirillaceae bacterium]